MSFMPIMTNGLNWLPPHLVGYGGAMNNIMQRMSSALGVAAMGILITQQTAQVTADTGALLTPRNAPQYQGASQETLYQLYEYVQARVAAVADSDMFLTATAATAVCGLLALMLKKPPSRAARSTPPARPTRPVTPAATPRPRRRPAPVDTDERPVHRRAGGVALR
jgi:hypothetical protein